MSEKTHETDKDVGNKPDGRRKFCIYCESWINGHQWNELCPEHPDREFNSEENDMIEKGDEVITQDGLVLTVEIVENTGLQLEGWGFRDFEWMVHEMVAVDSPLRVRVESEEEARELVEMVEDYNMFVTPYADFSEVDSFLLHFGEKKPFDEYQAIDWNDRKPQVDAYLDYHSEQEADMSDDHPLEEVIDTKRQREIAERFMSGDEREWRIFRDYDLTGEQFNDALRSQLELKDEDDLWPVCHYCQPEGKTEPIMESEEAVTIHRHHLDELKNEGVCEWTWDDTHKKWDTDCEEAFQFTEGGPQENSFEACPYCASPIEVVEEDEETEYEVGDLVKFDHSEMHDYEWDYAIVADLSVDGWPMLVDGFGNPPESIEPYKVNHLASFQPTEGFFEELPGQCNGSLVLVDDEIMFDPVCREEYSIGSAYDLFMQDGDAYRSMDPKTTGIIVTVEELRDIFEEK